MMALATMMIISRGSMATKEGTMRTELIRAVVYFFLARSQPLFRNYSLNLLNGVLLVKVIRLLT